MKVWSHINLSVILVKLFKIVLRISHFGLSSLGPDKVLYALHLGEGNSIVLGLFDPKEEHGTCAILSIRCEHPENGRTHFIVTFILRYAYLLRKVQIELFRSNLTPGINLE